MHTFAQQVEYFKLEVAGHHRFYINGSLLAERIRLVFDADDLAVQVVGRRSAVVGSIQDQEITARSNGARECNRHRADG